MNPTDRKFVGFFIMVTFVFQFYSMKHLLVILLSCFLFTAIQAQQKDSISISKPDTKQKIKEVEVACGQCQFKMKGSGCNLAIRIDGKSYFVDGTSIDEHGDAHADDGFCNAIRKAKVQGKVMNDRYKVTYFKLMPVRSNH